MRGHSTSISNPLALLCVILPALIVTHPGAAAGAEASQVVPYTVVETGRTSGIREPAQMVIRDAAAWAALWRRHAGATGKPVPVVDFSREMVIALFAGDSPAPRVVTIARIIREADAIVVWYTLADTRPPVDGARLRASSHFQIVRLARSPSPVKFMRMKTPQMQRNAP